MDLQLLAGGIFREGEFVTINLSGMGIATISLERTSKVVVLEISLGKLLRYLPHRLHGSSFACGHVIYYCDAGGKLFNRFFEMCDVYTVADAKS